MKLAFYKAQRGNWLDERIADHDHGRYSHVELVMEDGHPETALCFSSSNRDHGVRYKAIDITDGKWDVVNLPNLNGEPEVKAALWCTSKLGAGYDWPGVFGFVCPLIHEDLKKWFCSEIVLTALQEAGMFLGIDAGEVSPNRLYAIATGHWPERGAGE